jgi:hypothetical protein
MLRPYLHCIAKYVYVYMYQENISAPKTNYGVTCIVWKEKSSCKNFSMWGTTPFGRVLIAFNNFFTSNSRLTGTRSVGMSFFCLSYKIFIKILHNYKYSHLF